MKPKEQERIDLLLGAVEADIEQAYIEVMKARGHALTLRAACEAYITDDESAADPQKP